ncbi:MAG: hypothetical protein EA412_10425 [Chitinophagaceae bacterium]|nr:MAG: hypothetical protein EA412_10425 [Chitinophagaceae bacterium]
MIENQINKLIKTFPLWFQFSVPFALGLLGMLIARLSMPEQNHEWRVAAVFLLIFVVINPILGIFKENWGKYTLHSFPVFVILFVLMLISADSISLLSIGDIAEYKLIFLLVGMFYFLLTLMALLYRTINEFFQKMQ